jgi:hypothetical protein
MTTTPTLDQFEQFSRDAALAARAVLMAQAFAQLERERVDAYIRPIFDSFRPGYGPDGARCGLTGVITDMTDLYLCEDEARCTRPTTPRVRAAHRRMALPARPATAPRSWRKTL